MGEAVEHFSYDLVGNRTTDAKTGTNQWSYNNNNELQGFDTTSFKYNLNGQMTEKTVNGQKTTYSYNLDGRLKEIKDNSSQVIAQYQYDPFGRRISKTLPQESKTTYFHYNQEGLIGEYNKSGSYIQSYGYIPGSFYSSHPMYSQRADFVSKAKGGYVYYINDHLGTPQKLITETGRKVWEAHANAFGKTIVVNDEFRNLLGFPGHYKDDESNLIYNWNRYYDIELGRYISSDPLGLIGGVNEFGYVYGQPLSYVDVTGETPAVWTWCVTGPWGCAAAAATTVATIWLLSSPGQEALLQCYNDISDMSPSNGVGFDDDYPDLPGWLDDQPMSPMFPGQDPDDDDFTKRPPIQNHHKVPWNNSTHPHWKHGLARQAYKNPKGSLKHSPNNQMRLGNHSSRHSKSYHDTVRGIMDKHYMRVKGKGPKAAQNAMDDVYREIERGIANGSIKPYDSKGVFIP